MRVFEDGTTLSTKADEAVLAASRRRSARKGWVGIAVLADVQAVLALLAQYPLFYRATPLWLSVVVGVHLVIAGLAAAFNFMNRLTDGGGGCMFPVTLASLLAPTMAQEVLQFGDVGVLPWWALFAAPVLTLVIAAFLGGEIGFVAYEIPDRSKHLDWVWVQRAIRNAEPDGMYPPERTAVVSDSGDEAIDEAPRSQT